MKFLPVSHFLAVLLLSVPAWAASAGEDARTWLEQMSQAVQSLNYLGTFVHQHDGRLEAMRIVHVSDEQGEREKLYSLTGPKREVIRDNQVVTCILGDQQSVIVNKSRPRQPFPAGFPEDLGNLERYYRFEQIGYDRVAGRPCHLIAIRPRDRFRYGQRLCIGKDTNMLLRSELTDEQGRSIERMMFTWIEFPAQVSEAALRPDFEEAGFRWSKEPEAAPHADRREQRWQVKQVPAGFMMTDHNWHRLEEHKPGVEHWVYSDGLASVSVYVEKAPDEEEYYRGVSRRGALNAVGTMVSGHYVTVVGEVPLATVQMIAQSVRHRP